MAGAEGVTGRDRRALHLASLEAVFEPRRVAVVGASDREGKTGTVFMRNLSRFEGEVVPVTASSEAVDGRRAYPSLREVPGRIDLAVAVVPAEAVPAVAEDAAAAGVGAVVAIAGGFAEIGEEGAALQERVVAAARAGGVRVVGPNCLGVQNCHTGLNASMMVGTLEEGGDIALATQSGAYGMAIYTLGSEEHLRFSKLYAAGNKADLTDAEVLAYLAADEQSSVLCFFLESLTDGRAFCELVREVTPRKPVIVSRTGRTEAGARAALSHTAALAGRADVWRAVVEQSGAVVTRTGQEMMDAAKALDWQPVPRGPRVGVITNSGGTGVELSDLLAEEGLEVPELSPELQRELAAVLPPYGSARNPVDVTPAWGRFAELYPRCVDALARSGEVDAVIPVLLQRSAMDRAVAEGVGAATERLAAERVEVPVYVCWVAPEEARGNRDLLQAGAVPCFDWPARTARAAALAWRYGRRRGELPSAPPPPERPGGLPALAPGLLGPEEAVALAGAFRIDTPAQVVCADPAAAADAAGVLDAPLVAKLASERFPHKSDVGAVRTGLAGRAALRSAAEELLRLDPGGRVVVQEQAAGTDVIVGAFRDPAFGPVVMAGLGGVLVEVLHDVAFSLAPVGEAEAERMLASLRGQSVLHGARGRDPVDLRSLAAVVAAASRLVAALPEVGELDLNPVLASPDGAVAVDVRIVVSGPAS